MGPIVFKFVRDATTVARRLNRLGFVAYIERPEGAKRGSYKCHTALTTSAPAEIVTREIEGFEIVGPSAVKK
jgi:hypothetical protein